MNDSNKPGDIEVGVAWVADHLDDPTVRIVEVDVSPAGYEKGHIPGAVLWDAYVDLRHPDYSLISHDELEELVRRTGIESDTTVVFCGYGAHLGYWLLTSHGHHGARLMDGSRDQWLDAGHTWSTDVPAPSRSAYELGPQERYVASEEEVRSMMESGEGAILDVRSEAEFTGVNFWPSGAPETVGRRGHVPGADFAPVAPIRTSDSRFVALDQVSAALQPHVPDQSTPIITYCTIGNRASQVWYALTVLLGYENVRVYYGSWVEWGMEQDTPIET